MSLCTLHPIWTSVGCSQFEMRKATIQARMLSGRDRTCWMRRHWSGDPTGSCRVPGCSGEPGTLKHMVTGECSGLKSALIRATSAWSSFLKENGVLLPIVQHYSLGDQDVFLSFLLDPTTLPAVIVLSQEYGPVIRDQLCYMTRTWLYCMHKERLKLLKLWR